MSIKKPIKSVLLKNVIAKAQPVVVTLMLFRFFLSARKAFPTIRKFGKFLSKINLFNVFL